MQLKHIEIIQSPDFGDRVRLVGKVEYDNKTFAPEKYWYEVPAIYEQSLTRSGNPWLVGLAPLAFTLGEPLEICAPVDPMLFKNIKEVVQIWKCWYPDLHIIKIKAELASNENKERPNRTAAFFSGGVDSFFTVLRHNNINDSEDWIHIDDLLIVGGFDIRLRNYEAFQRMRNTLQEAAFELGKNFIDITTNLKETSFRQCDWGNLSHGCALASIAHIFENKYGKVLIASTDGYRSLNPRGSHVLTDPLLSTSITTIIHDGAAFNRIQKTALVAKSKIAMKSLHVCWVVGDEKNCSRCSKCFRTMMMLDLYGALESFITFKREHYNLRSISKTYLQHVYDLEYAIQIRDLALDRNRLDLVKAIDQSIRHSKRLNIFLPIAKRINKYLSAKSFIWRYSDILERILLNKSIL